MALHHTPPSFSSNQVHWHFVTQGSHQHWSGVPTSYNCLRYSPSSLLYPHLYAGTLHPSSSSTARLGFTRDPLGSKGLHCWSTAQAAVPLSQACSSVSVITYRYIATPPAIKMLLHTAAPSTPPMGWLSPTLGPSSGPNGFSATCRSIHAQLWPLWWADCSPATCRSARTHDASPGRCTTKWSLGSWTAVLHRQPLLRHPWDCCIHA